MVLKTESEFLEKMHQERNYLYFTFPNTSYKSDVK